MELDHFDYAYPPSAVAVEPLADACSARLLVFDRQSQQLHSKQILNLLDFIAESDLLVFNRSKVFPARFEIQKASGATCEALYLAGNESQVDLWLQGKWKSGDTARLLNGREVLILSRRGKEATLKISRTDLESYLQSFGKMPIPPYIRKERKRRALQETWSLDSERYQNPFAQEKALLSRAAPTASLHFDDRLQAELEKQNIATCSIELEVGLGTFAPIEVKSLNEHQMHRERYRVSDLSWQKIKKTKGAGGRVIAVGTTVLRALEARARLPQEGDVDTDTDLFIQPGFDFQVVDGLVTNFHQPQSTLLILVASFMEFGRASLENHWRKAYDLAIQDDFRLFSYGDAMLIL